MSNFVKPQSPIYNESLDTYIYPLTTSDQVIMPDGTRLDAENIGSGMKMELLWKNASLSSSFAAQDISIPQLNNYDFLVFLVDGNINDHSTYSSFIVEKSKIIFDLSTVQYNTKVYITCRKVSIDYANGKISFGSGSENGIVEGIRCIPREIYGIKGSI